MLYASIAQCSYAVICNASMLHFTIICQTDINRYFLKVLFSDVSLYRLMQWQTRWLSYDVYIVWIKIKPNKLIQDPPCTQHTLGTTHVHCIWLCDGPDGQVARSTITAGKGSLPAL